mmetsp:Transcript_34204/g.30940  ORF Transcript_34204/g.30940 Transcript_34204/m.30940 type:complete len:85 (+) Transcript_34204:690-944(+)
MIGEIQNKCRPLIEQENNMLNGTGLKWIMPYEDVRQIILWKDQFIRNKQQEFKQQNPNAFDNVDMGGLGTNPIQGGDFNNGYGG